jgi:hypothetical protein
MLPITIPRTSVNRSSPKLKTFGCFNFSKNGVTENPFPAGISSIEAFSGRLPVLGDKLEAWDAKWLKSVYNAHSAR